MYNIVIVDDHHPVGDIDLAAILYAGKHRKPWLRYAISIVNV